MFGGIFNRPPNIKALRDKRDVHGLHKALSYSASHIKDDKLRSYETAKTVFPAALSLADIGNLESIPHIMNIFKNNPDGILNGMPDSCIALPQQIMAKFGRM